MFLLRRGLGLSLRCDSEERVSTQIPRPKSKSPDPLPKHTRYFDPKVEAFCVETFGPEDETLLSIRTDAETEGFPPIAITAMDGQVLSLLVSAANTKRAVEIGTLGGYSALWIARAMQPGGMLDCFELEVRRAQFALEHITRARPAVTVSLHIGPALDHLNEVLGPVDFVFIDADKENYPHYLEWAARNLRSGGIVAIDNSFAWGDLLDPAKAPRPEEAEGIRKTVENLSKDKRFRSCMIPTNEGMAVGVRV